MLGRYLSEEEIEQLLNSCDNHIRPIIITAIHTGMRRGEILRLKWEHIDLKNDIIHVYETKSGENRDIPITNTLKETLLKIKSDSCSEYVFTKINDKKMPLKDIKTIFSTALIKAGITNFRFHDLRHTFASHLVMNGVDLKTTQEFLGHKDFTMTLRYSHLSPQHKRDAIKVMDNINKLMDSHYSVTGYKI